MAQVTIYLDEETAARLRAAVASSGLSTSAWIARLVRERTSTEWPAEVAALACAWSNFPSLEELRESEAEDVPREPL